MSAGLRFENTIASPFPASSTWKSTSGGRRRAIEGGLMKEWRQLYNFWFGVPGTPESRLTARLPLWFLKDPEADQRSRDEFAPWLAEFDAGRLEHWRSDPRGTLSLVILLDQIPRNAFRGRPESFSYDKEALRVALNAIEQGIDEQLSTLERLFLYLPLEHSEELAMQRLSV